MMAWLKSFTLAPQFLWFLWLLPVIVILYLLKLRRTEAVISSTMLWMKSLQDLTANSPFQKLRKNLLLLLQLLIILLAVFALARPYAKMEGLSGSHYCLVIDHSASMQTLEGEDGKTRLELAKEKALELIDNLERGDKAMVVSFSENAEVKCEMTDDDYRLRAAINSIEPHDTRSNIRDVMMMAASLSPDNPDIPSTMPDLQLILLSDGQITDLEDIGARARDVVFQKIGETSYNAGVVALSMRENDSQDEMHQTLVSLYNAHFEVIETTLTLYLNDSAIGVEEVQLAPEGMTDTVFQHPDFQEGMMRVELDLDDRLAVDNQAWMTIQPAQVIKVLLVSDTNSSNSFYLKRALGVISDVELSEMSPSAYQTIEGYDLTIFDGFAPEILPQGSSVYINAFPKLEGLLPGEVIEAPPILGVDRKHPVMRYLSPENVGIGSATQFAVPPGSFELMTTNGTPLIADVSRNARQLLIIGFDISDSDWPLKLSFPLFMQNVVNWVPRTSTSAQQFVQSGTPIEFAAQDNESELSIKKPDGITSNIVVAPTHPVYYGDTALVGAYSVSQGESRYSIAVNLSSIEESNIKPSDTLSFGRGTIQATQKPLRTTREFWPILVLIALIILQFEWWIYSKRAWI